MSRKNAATLSGANSEAIAGRYIIALVGRLAALVPLWLRACGDIEWNFMLDPIRRKRNTPSAILGILSYLPLQGVKDT